jgi:hypothetical protein
VGLSAIAVKDHMIGYGLDAGVKPLVDEKKGFMGRYTGWAGTFSDKEM